MGNRACCQVNDKLGFEEIKFEQSSGPKSTARQRSHLVTKNS